MSQLREGKEMDNDNAHNGWPGDGGIARSGFRLGGGSCGLMEDGISNNRTTSSRSRRTNQEPPRLPLILTRNPSPRGHR